MKLSAALILTLAGWTLATASSIFTSSLDCHANNCNRAVTGTFQGTAQVQTARSDCSSFLQATVTAQGITTTVTTTVVGRISKRALTTVPGKLIPVYASPCSDSIQYSSACACWGIAGATITQSATAVTITVTTTSSASATHSSNCTASILTDSQNCGACGKACAAGQICENGVCSDGECDAQTCDTGFKNCGNSDNCFCFTDSNGRGFCAQNEICSGLKSCTTNDDCGKGNICAIKSCCVDPVCLPGGCANPARLLIRLSKARWQSGTAAFN